MVLAELQATTDHALVERMARGDERAVQALVGRHGDALFALVRSILQDRAVAEEVAADVFLQAWRKASSFDPGRATVIAWLAMIARSRALDRLRARKRAHAAMAREGEATRWGEGEHVTGPLSGCAECRSAVQEFRDVAGLLIHAIDQLTRRVGGLETTISSRDLALAERDSVLRYLTGPEVHLVSLAAGGDKPVARVFWNHTENRFILTAFALPPARPGRTYQLWAIAEGSAPVSMGTFNTENDGAATAIFVVGDEINSLGFIQLCALTEEPMGGSPAPTETPRLMGEWRHTD